MTLSRILRAPVVRLLLLGVTFGFIAWALHGQWEEVRKSARALDLQWRWILLASGIVLGTYAMLVQSWRMLLSGWGGHLPYGKAVQIWTVANLGRYLPGKVWSIGALGVLAAREGVSGVAASGAAVLGTLLNIGAGFGVAVVFGAGLLDAIAPGMQRVALIAAVVFLIGVVALPFVLPVLLDRLARWRGVPLATQHLRNHEVWFAVVINTVSWMGYGLAFTCFARGTLPTLKLDASIAIGVYAASYLVGFLVLFAPGGVGFREFALGALLVAGGFAGQGDAAILGATSRVWLTVLEVLPGLIGVLLMSPAQRAGLRRSGDESQPVKGVR